MTRCRTIVCTLTLAVTLVLAGCGGNMTGRPSAAVSTVTASPPGAAGPTATTRTPITYACNTTWNYAPNVRVGDLWLAPTAANPGSTLVQLPDGTPLRPLKVPTQTGWAEFAGWPASTLGATSVYATVCNGSATTAHTIQGVRVKLTAFTAYAARLSAWDYCAGSYARPAGVTAPDCGHGPAPPDEELQATFAATAHPGTIVSATQSAPPSNGFGPLPAVLPPGALMYLIVQLTAPAAPGTYTFAASITTDGAEMPFTVGTSLLLAPIAHRWNGQACTASGMLAQIPPATTPPTPYICPVS